MEGKGGGMEVTAEDLGRIGFCRWVLFLFLFFLFYVLLFFFTLPLCWAL